MVKYSIGSGLDSLKTVFSRVLVLLVWFTLPAPYKKGTEDILKLFTDFNLGAVTDKFIGCTMLMDIIFKGVDKLLVSFNAVDVTNHGITTNKELGNSNTTVNSRIHSICCHRFIAVVHINAGLGT